MYTLIEVRLNDFYYTSESIPCISFSASVISCIDWLMFSKAWTTALVSPHLTPLMTTGMFYNKGTQYHLCKTFSGIFLYNLCP